MSLPEHLLLFLGLPVYSLPKEFIQQRLSLLAEEKKEMPSYVTSLKAGFISRLNQNVTETLRQASFLGIDSKFLQIVAKALGNPIPHRISSQDLLHAAAAYASKHHQALYLIGSNLDSCHQAAKALKEDYSGLKIAGFVAPNIYIKGQNIELSSERDPWIVDSINSTKPAILLLDLGHPKEEIWFDRIKHLLKVPLCIGVEGSFEEYLKNRFQREKTFSFSWDRFKKGLKTAGYYSYRIPQLLLFNTVNRLLSKFSAKHSQDRKALFLSEKESLFVISFPSSIYEQAWSENPAWIEECLEYDDIVLDFTAVRHLDLAGFGLLYKVWMQTARYNKSLFLLGLSGDMQYLFKLQGVWDLFKNHVVQDADEVLDRMSINRGAQLKKEREFISIFQTDHSTILSFFGRIDKMETQSHSLNHLEPLLSQRSCIVNLKFCTSISNQGFAFLLKLRTLLQSHGHELTLSTVNKTVKRELKACQLDAVFTLKNV